MNKPLYDKKVLRGRGLVTNGFYLSYNLKLTAKANELRKNMTTKDGGYPFKGQGIKKRLSMKQK